MLHRCFAGACHSFGVEMNNAFRSKHIGAPSPLPIFPAFGLHASHRHPHPPLPRPVSGPVEESSLCTCFRWQAVD